ncbi:hypothetical protein QJS10_CPA09g00425 [Acorus calamus]|uniref:3-dehydroquinate synthase n=1 Tax=Acorus calamus TaxID=4465 RepID=A0AAV9E4T0_ACOCL|nr:hypothetical protein QJS10_CPA09g00425 [Acorus calamus]
MSVLILPPLGIQISSHRCTTSKEVGFMNPVAPKRTHPHISMSSSSSSSAGAPRNQKRRSKTVWVWTESKQVMTAAVERGWDTFVFDSGHRFRQLALDWSSIALIHPLFVEGLEILDSENKRVANLCEVSSSEQLELIQPDERQAECLVISLSGEWQVIPAENIVAELQSCQKTVYAVARTSEAAQVFFEALEQGLDGVVLKVEDVGDVLELKDYFDKRDEERNRLPLTKATITRVGSFARGLFLVHSECTESNYIASRPFRIFRLSHRNVKGPVHAYVAIPGGKTCYLSELQSGKEVIVVSESGRQRAAFVGRVKIESRPLVLVEAKLEGEPDDQATFSIILQNAETVGLVGSHERDNPLKTLIPVTSLKAGDEVLLRVQGGARHTGIEIQEFIVEK